MLQTRRRAPERPRPSRPCCPLIGDAEEFRSAVVINRSLGELYKLQARNKINPRRAAVMAYTCNLLLRTLPAIAHELHPELEDQPQIIIDLPRPKRD